MFYSIENLAAATCDMAREIYGDDSFTLHLSEFEGNQRRYLIDCIDSNFVPSVGDKVTEFAELVAEYIRSRYAIYIEFRSFIINIL